MNGDKITVRLFQEVNHSGAAIEFLIDGGVVLEMQIKAVQSPASIEYFSRHPDTEVLATSEITALLGGVLGGKYYGLRLQQ